MVDPNSGVECDDILVSTYNGDSDLEDGHVGIWKKVRRSEFILNLHTPVAQKVVDEVIFRGFQGEGVEFFKNRRIPQILMRIFWKIPI